MEYYNPAYFLNIDMEWDLDLMGAIADKNERVLDVNNITYSIDSYNINVVDKDHYTITFDISFRTKDKNGNFVFRLERINLGLEISAATFEIKLINIFAQSPNQNLITMKMYADTL